ncbi:substrate-binding periplasmic protein [Maridesulfovibrio sp.]|uniref:substrate-binding periplasmic protein n=1 Tax=Maridesulfovibrio sp. TaxID=2795000 RepID=UPI003BA9F6D0
MFTPIYKTTVAVLITVLFTASWCFAEQKTPQHIKILCGYRFPPFYTVTNKKEPSKNLHGTFIDLMDEFQNKHPEYSIEYKCLPRARISKQLIHGRADGYALTDPMFLQPETKSNYLHSKPMWTVADHLLVLKDSPITKADFGSLTGTTIAVLHGNDYGPLNYYFKEGLINKHPVYSTKQILELVVKKRVDAAICNKMTLPGLMKETEHTMDQFRIINEPLYSFKLHLIVHRTHAALLNDFNDFIKKSSITDTQ